MNPDPVYHRLREAGWRRPLTESEQAELRAWLAAHPKAAADWESEAELSALLGRLPDAPVSSNFTARVLQAVEREARADQRKGVPRWAWWWRVLVPRAAVAAVVVGLGVFAYQRHKVTQRAELARGLVMMVDGKPLPSPQALEDFEVIRRLSQTPAWDEDLLALMQ